MSTRDVPDRIRDLDTRRAWARARAPFWFLVGAVTIALFNTTLVLIVLAGVARAWSWGTGEGFGESPLWDEFGLLAAAVTVGAFAISLLYLVVHVVSSAPSQVLSDIGAKPIATGIFEQAENVVDGLAIGLGTLPPELWVVEDLAPNALSLRSRKRKVLVVTIGLTQFPRDELEAVCAHEMAHMHAVDAQWVTAAGSSVQRARRYATVVATLGALIVGGLLYAGGTWVSGYAFGIALAVVGFLAAALLGRTTRRIRSEADDVADVAAVHLAKNPFALGQALDRVASDPRRVMHNTWRSELLWFETTEEDAGLTSGSRERREVNRRAEAAYATARRERPDAPAPTA